MQLTKKERLILFNQYRILEKLDPDAEDYNKIKDVLFYGYEYEYDFLVNHFSTVPKEICEEVNDILLMYRGLYDSYQILDDKSDINENDVKFQGFDGNEEEDHYTYVEFVIKKVKRFEEFNKIDLNSHRNRLKKYKKMLDIWKNFDIYSDLSKEQILEILGK